MKWKSKTIRSLAVIAVLMLFLNPEIIVPLTFLIDAIGFDMLVLLAEAQIISILAYLSVMSISRTSIRNRSLSSSS